MCWKLPNGGTVEASKVSEVILQVPQKGRSTLSFIYASLDISSAREQYAFSCVNKHFHAPAAKTRLHIGDILAKKRWSIS